MLLTLLDFSAAFDILNHGTLFGCLHAIFDISSKALQWFSSYLSNRFQAVGVKVRISSQENIDYGVPQGSCLRPVLFCMCIQPLSEVISHSNCGHQKFADCTQFRMSSILSDFDLQTVDVEQCTDSTGRCMTGNWLKLNNDNTEVLLVGSRSMVSVSQDDHLRVGNHDMFFKSHGNKSRGLH